MKQTAAAIALCAALVTGCATAPTPLATPSGNPEVTVAASRSEIASGILAVLAEDGRAHEARVVQDTPQSFAVEWPNRDFWSNAVHASSYDPQSYVRLIIHIIEQEDELRLLGSIAAVTNPGSGLEYVKPLNDPTTRRTTQYYLEKLSAELQKRQAKNL